MDTATADALAATAERPDARIESRLVLPEIGVTLADAEFAATQCSAVVVVGPHSAPDEFDGTDRAQRVAAAFSNCGVATRLVQWTGTMDALRRSATETSIWTMGTARLVFPLWDDETGPISADVEEQLRSLRATRFAVTPRPTTVIPITPASSGATPKLGSGPAHATASASTRAEARERAIELCLTDSGNAHRLWEREKDRVCWNIEHKQFFVYRDGRWVLDHDGNTLLRLATESEQAFAATDPVFAPKSGALVRMQRALQCLKIIDGAAVHAVDFDTQHDLLPVRNGVIDLRTGLLAEHNAALRFTRQAPVTFDASAPEPTEWLQFITAITTRPDGTHDAQLAEWLQVYLGYCLTGRTDEQSFLVICGSGGNGKGVIDRMMTCILGLADHAGFAGTASMSLLMAASQSRAESATPKQAALHGLRWLCASEGVEGGVMRATLLKSLSGGDSVNTSPLYGSPLEFMPTHKLVIMSNHHPTFKNLDDATASRIQIVQLHQSFVMSGNAQAVTSFRDEQAMLRNEASGILNWLLAGARTWYARAAAGAASGVRTRGRIGLPDSIHIRDERASCIKS